MTKKNRIRWVDACWIAIHCNPCSAAVLLRDCNPFVWTAFNFRRLCLCLSFEGALKELQEDARCSIVYPDKLKSFREEYASTYAKHVNKMIQSLSDYELSTLPDTKTIIKRVALELTPERTTVK